MIVGVASILGCVEKKTGPVLNPGILVPVAARSLDPAPEARGLLVVEIEASGSIAARSPTGDEGRMAFLLLLDPNRIPEWVGKGGRPQEVGWEIRLVVRDGVRKVWLNRRWMEDLPCEDPAGPHELPTLDRNIASLQSSIPNAIWYLTCPDTIPFGYLTGLLDTLLPHHQNIIAFYDQKRYRRRD